jgi:hypothetical protein
MKKAVLLLIIFSSNILFSQQLISDLEKVIEDFETPPGWVVESTEPEAPLYITKVIMKACSQDLLSDEPAQEFVLGIKVEQYEIGEYSIKVRPREPVYLGNGVYRLSYWTHGYNNNHFVKMVLLDENLEPVPDWLWSSNEKLNFFGWRQIIYNLNNFLRGKELYFNGFIITINPLESIIDNYFYFDFIKMEYLSYE